MNTVPTSALAELRAQANGDMERFTIDTPEKADWLLRKLAGIDAEKATVQAMAAQRTQELDADRNALLSRFGAELEAWAREEATARRRKTVTLLHGAISFRTVPAKLIVESEADAITTARAVAPETVTQETTERFDKAAFLAHAKAHLESTGEILPGLTQSEERESFSIKTGGSAIGG